MKNVLKPLDKSVLIPLGLTAAVSATDVLIQKKVFGKGTTTIAFSNESLNDTMKIVRKKHSGIFVHSDLKCPFIKISINSVSKIIKK